MDCSSFVVIARSCEVMSACYFRAQNLKELTIAEWRRATFLRSVVMRSTPNILLASLGSAVITSEVKAARSSEALVMSILSTHMATD